MLPLLWDSSLQKSNCKGVLKIFYLNQEPLVQFTHWQIISSKNACQQGWMNLFEVPSLHTLHSTNSLHKYSTLKLPILSSNNMLIDTKLTVFNLKEKSLKFKIF